MFASNINANYQEAFQIQQTQFGNSIESGSSIGSSSFLVAANTVFLNGSTPSKSSPSSYGSILKLSSSNSRFSNTLLQAQNNNDLDFDLHLLNSKIEKENDRKKKYTNNSNVGQILFKDDDNLFNQEEMSDLEEDEFEYDLNQDYLNSNSDLSLEKSLYKNNNNNSNNNFEVNQQTGYLQSPSSSNQNFLINNLAKSVSMPIENVLFNQNNNINKSNQDQLKLSPGSNLACASITPTSNILIDSTPTTKNTTSRTLMKLQLMKQQTEMERRAASNLSTTLTNSNTNNQMFYLSSNNNTNNNNLDELSISLKNDSYFPSSTSLTSSEIIPRSILPEVYKTETKLEFPTKYHVMQIAKHLQQSTLQNDSNLSSLKSKSKYNTKNLRPRANSNKSNSFKQNQLQLQQQQYLNLDFIQDFNLSNKIEITKNNSPFQPDYTSATVSSHHSLDSQSSNLDSTRLTSPTNSSFSQNDFIDELEDLVPDELNGNLSLNKPSFSSNLTNSQIQEEINEIERVLNLPKTLPNEGYLKIMTPPLTPSVRPSSSCPADIAKLKKLQGHLTEDEIKLIIKDRQKKDNHNMVERRRRFNINDRIKELGTILPKSNPSDKQNKGSILRSSVDYIKKLQNELNKTKELEEQLNKMTILNRKLIEKIKTLENGDSNLNLNYKNRNNSSSLFNLVNSPSILQTQNLVPQQQPHIPNLNINEINQIEKFILTQEQNANKTNENLIFINESKTLEDLLQSTSSTIKNQENDPLLSHSNHLFDESLMDSFD